MEHEKFERRRKGELGFGKLERWRKGWRAGACKNLGVREKESEEQ